jgi:opacity protein-like surface antigen
MRRLLLAAAMFGTACGAQAADMPDVLRGTFAPAPVSRNWDGWYVGGQANYTASEMDFSRSVVSLTNFIFRNSVLQVPTSQLSLLSKNHTQGYGFGAFAGRNWQWDEAVFGLEANYSYIANLSSSSANSLSRAIVNPTGTVAPINHTYTYNTTLSGSAAVQVKDVLTLRARGGWAAGNFMPYIFGGLAVGRMDVARSVTSNVVLRDDAVQTTIDQFGNTTTVNLAPVFSNIPSLSQSMQEQRTSSFVAGWTAGLGTEYCLFGNVFMRAEWEYIKFLSVKDTVVTLNTGRVGIGYKF